MLRKRTEDGQRLPTSYTLRGRTRRLVNWAAGAKGISRSEWVEALLERAAARQALKEGAADEDILAMARAVAEESGR